MGLLLGCVDGDDVGCDDGNSDGALEGRRDGPAADVVKS